jgi:epoxyqueuosine reductase
MKLDERIRRQARELGFDLAGIAPVRPAVRGAEFRRWLDRGFAGGMGWMGNTRAARCDPSRVLPGAKSAVVVGLGYRLQDPPPELWNDPLRGRVARYAWGRDYHDVMRPMLEALADFIAAASGRPVAWKAFADSGPVMERDLAERAGLGFPGKNTNLIHPRIGSQFFIGELLLDRELDFDTPPAMPSCGACSACLSACPTGALVAPRILDARRCISYLTIEHRGAIPEALRPRMGNWVFGCDECQQVCPWVLQAGGRPPPPHAGRFLRFDPDVCAPRLVDLVALDETRFKERFAGTPLLRARRSGFLRNVAVALGNSRHPDARAGLEQLSGDADAGVREHARWALDFPGTDAM